jgi:hypothetical protein
MIIDNSGTGIASLGRDEDRFVAHVAPGERVVPPVISADTQARLSREMMAAGLDPDEYIVGPHMSINPITGQPEFGWFKKTFKSLKKVAKKVAPVAALVPGVGTAFGGLLGGIGGLATKIPGIGGALGSIGSTVAGGIANLGIPGISSIAGGTAGGFGGIGKALTTKAGLFGGGPLAGIMGVGGPQVPEGLEIGADGMYVDAAGNTYDYQQLVDMGVMDRSGNIINTPLADLSNRGGFLDTARDFIRPGQEGQSRLGMIEDMIKGRPSDPVRAGGGFLGGSPGQGGGGSMFGGNLGLMGLAGLAGKIAYDSSKERMGGIAETPKVTMDQLGRYQMAQNLGTGGSRADFDLAPAPVALDFAYGGEARQYFNEGGLATMIDELDMREGGESEGPGTGTSDDIPAMLSDGEFVMTAKATRGAGAFDVNKTKSGIELIKGGSASREEGVKNMRELMNIFEAI